MYLKVFGNSESGHQSKGQDKNQICVETVFVEFEDVLSSAVIKRFVIVVHFVYVRAHVSDLFESYPCKYTD